MAGIIKQKRAKGFGYVIKLSEGEDERRPKISLGRCTKAEANTAKVNIESLIRSNDTGAVMSVSTSEWLGKISDGLRKRLEKLGLTEKQAGLCSNWTVKSFIANYITKRTDIKPGTRTRLHDVEKKLVSFFPNTPIDTVTKQQAKDFRSYLKSSIGLCENTTRKHIAISRQFFKAAIDSELITKNPFKDDKLPVKIRPNPNKFFYVTPEMAVKILDACPDAQWRLIFGLARYGGLRCPSEVLRLKWEDVDFDNERFYVYSSKTEHHADNGVRTVPMFPELKPLLLEAFEQAKDGTVYVIEKTRNNEANLRTTMSRIIRRAGFEPWPKLFVNMRSTRETELFKLTNGEIKAVCSWIGNSPLVALEHYSQVTEAAQTEATRMSILGRAEKMVKNEGTELGTESHRNELQRYAKP